MKTIFKYPLEVKHEQKIKMPYKSQALCVQVIGNIPTIYAIVNKHCEEVDRTFVTIATGEEFPDNDNLKYIGTYQLIGGELIFHVFEQI